MKLDVSLRHAARSYLPGSAAALTPARKSRLSTPLMKKAEAPALIAIRRTDGSSLAVSTMTRVEGETRRSRVCTSNPLICGIRMSITATSGQCAAACSKNAIGSVKASTFQPAESRSRRVALRIEVSSSSRYTAAVSLLSASILISHAQNRTRLARWFCARNQNESVFTHNITHGTTLACQSSGTQLDLSPGFGHWGHFSFLQYYHYLSNGGNPELLHYVGTMRLDFFFGHSPPT